MAEPKDFFGCLAIGKNLCVFIIIMSWQGQPALSEKTAQHQEKVMKRRKMRKSQGEALNQ